VSGPGGEWGDEFNPQTSRDFAIDFRGSLVPRDIEIPPSPPTFSISLPMVQDMKWIT